MIQLTSVYTFVLSFAILTLGFALPASAAPKPLPTFQAQTLNEQPVSNEALKGQPGILIVTPSQEAGDQSSQWAQLIRKEFGEGFRQRTIIAVDLPFMVTEYMAVNRARGKVEERYWDRTWLLIGSEFESQLGIPPESSEAFALAINPQGQVVAQVKGAPNPEKLVQLEKALKNAK